MCIGELADERATKQNQGMTSTRTHTKLNGNYWVLGCCWALSFELQACSGGQTGDEGPVLTPICSIDSYEEIGLDEVSGIGFVAAKAFEPAFGEHTLPFSWNPPYPGHPPPFLLPET